MVGANIIFWLFALIPFQFSLFSVGGSDVPVIRLLIPILFFAWLLRSLVKKEVSLPRPATLASLTLFLGWALLSLYWAENQQMALRKIVFWVNFFPLFILLVAVFRNEAVRKQALKVLVLGGASIALVGIGQFFLQFFLSPALFLDYWFPVLQFFLGVNFAQVILEYPSIFVNVGGVTLLRAFAFFPDPHIFAYYTSMLIPVAWYQSQQKNKNYFYTVAPYLLLLATLLSFSRASYVALLISGLLASALFVWQKKKSLSVPVILIGLGIVVVLALSPVATRFSSSFSQDDGSVKERSRLWHEAVTNIYENPIFGTGLGNYPLLVKPTAVEREPIYVHNLYLDITVELGLIGLVSFLFFIVSCLPHFGALFQKQSELPSYRFALFSALIIFLSYSLFEYPLFSVHILPLLLTILALLYVEKTRV